MGIQISVGVRFTLTGDGETDTLVLDLTRSIVQFPDGRYGVLRLVPDEIISLRMGGPDVNPEDEVSRKLVDAKLDGSRLHLKFSRPLQQYRDGYTVEIVFGYHGEEPQQDAVDNMDV